jgi:hypothetical protein
LAERRVNGQVTLINSCYFVHATHKMQENRR